jgi:hypothetical protein
MRKWDLKAWRKKIEAHIIVEEPIKEETPIDRLEEL